MRRATFLGSDGVENLTGYQGTGMRCSAGLVVLVPGMLSWSARDRQLTGTRQCLPMRCIVSLAVVRKIRMLVVWPRRLFERRAQSGGSSQSGQHFARSQAAFFGANIMSGTPCLQL